MSLLNAIIQGIVQGLTEFLPISSSGHLSLIQYFTGQSGESGVLFTVILHLGTLLAVVLAFFGTIAGLVAEFFRMLRDLFTGRFTTRDMPGRRRMILLLIVSMFPMLLTVLLRDWFSSLASDDSVLAEGLCFLLTSALLFLSDRCVKGRKNAKTMRTRDALAIGAMQAVAPLPGLSRSGSTISMGLLVGLERKYAVAFSFIMGIPAVLGANILEIGDAVREASAVSIPVVPLLAGLACSLLFGLLAIKLVNWLVTSDKFKYFAWYTLILGLLTVAAAVIELMSDHAIRRIIAGA